MSEPRQPPPLRVGDRARAKPTRRVGTVHEVTTSEGGHRLYRLQYDEALQDAFIATSPADDVLLPAELVEPAE